MKREAEIVVIGGGIMGASVAYNLAKKGKEVVVLEQNEICSGTSSATAGWLWVQDRRPDHYARLSWSSLQNYKTLEQELGADFEYRIVGGLDPLRTEEKLASAMKLAEEQQKIGIDVRVLSRDEVLEKEPVINPRILGALYSEFDGHINPFLLVNAYVQAAKRFGAEINTFTSAEDFVIENNAIKEIVTNKGKIKPNLVICAAGIYSKEIGRKVGVDIPVKPERGFCLVSERLPKALSTVIIGARQTVSGNIIFGFIQDPVEGIDRKMYIRGLNWAAQDIMRDFPGFGDINIIRSYTGIRCKPLDKYPIVGPTRKLKNFWTAITHSAFGLNAALSPMVAELVTGERDIKSIPEYAYDRFLQ